MRKLILAAFFGIPAAVIACSVGVYFRYSSSSRPTIDLANPEARLVAAQQGDAPQIVLMSLKPLFEPRNPSETSPIVVEAALVNPLAVSLTCSGIGPFDDGKFEPRYRVFREERGQWVDEPIGICGNVKRGEMNLQPGQICRFTAILPASLNPTRIGVWGSRANSQSETIETIQSQSFPCDGR
jgi:hypothetical protein